MPPSWLNTVHHDGSEKYVSNLTPRLNDTVKIRLRIGERVPVREIYLRTAPDGEQAFTPMIPIKREPAGQWWEADLLINEPQVNYRFLIVAEDGVWFYSAAGITTYDPLDGTDFRLLADYDPPGWLQEAVFYQIFPDTFANGDPALNPTPEAFEYAGHRPRTYLWEEPLPAGAPYSQSYYGGDLPGIIQHLDYLEALGVNAIYLTPIFTAYSCHKYDVVDYDQIDPFLGGNEALAAFRQALNERGMRYILDIVPNHCGIAHRWFLAARADKTAPEFEFFTFSRYPDEYLCWGSSHKLVKLNYQSAELRQRMYENPDAPFRRWLRPPYSADGWRVDVGNMLGRQGPIQMNAEVIRGIRAAVKATHPDAYLMGENFHDASAQLQGDQWDGVMNYNGLSGPLMNWLRGFEADALGFAGKITAPVPFPTRALEATWRTRRAAIPWIITRQQFNLLSSHDVSRARSVLGENDALHRLAVTVQLTFPGVPCIYYGDEIGMVDRPDPIPRRDSSRACMTWDESRWNHNLLHFFRDLIALRRRSPVLQRGGFQMLLVEDDTFAYQREGPEGRVIVVAHRSEQPRPAGRLPVSPGGIPGGTRFVEHFSGQEAVVEDGALSLPEQPQGATLWETVA